MLCIQSCLIGFYLGYLCFKPLNKLIYILMIHIFNKLLVITCNRLLKQSTYTGRSRYELYNDLYTIVIPEITQKILNRFL